ncbi:glycosyltransferase family 4 protein [Leucobacter weissii]|nr:glycosyltransferase family 4 protein [Leucobacter weissii]
MAVVERLAAMREERSIVRALSQAQELIAEADRTADRASVDALIAAIAGRDQVMAIAAVHAAARIDSPVAEDALHAALEDPRTFIREHAAWASGEQPFREASLAALIELLTIGGLGGMLAQRTLQLWGAAAAASTAIAARLRSTLVQHEDALARRLLIETLGLLHHAGSADPLLRIARDAEEQAPVRHAAVAALGSRPAAARITAALEELRARGDDLSDTAALALEDLADQPGATTADAPRGAGSLRIAQLFLGADIDPELRRVGSGNNGGIATLLVRLGNALVDGPASGAGSDAETPPLPGVARVLTLSRGLGTATTAPSPTGDHTDSDADADARSDRTDAGARHAAGAAHRHVYAGVPLPLPVRRTEDSWSNLVAARRGIARELGRHGPIDVVHLRMADVGSFAAWQVAQDLRIPVVFTAAPDPHVLIESLQHSGKLTRENFGVWDEAERFWFRSWLVRELADSAQHTVLMPREHLRDDFRRLVGIDIGADPTRFSAVAEGIDVTVADAAVAEARLGEAGDAGAEPSAALRALREVLAPLPVSRRGLPLLITVGRLHPAKGMASLVEAWAGSTIRERCNLLIVGGDLRRPSADEAEQLRRIDRLIDPAQRAREGLLLAGHQPNSVAVRWLAAAQSGLADWVRPRGVYACASLKEEFGLAILEAMATGLLVVAPERGGPATYLDHGDTGFLTDTSNVETLRATLATALDAAEQPGPEARMARARSVVAERFSIRSMAEHLTRIYASVARTHAASRAGTAEEAAA